MNFICDSFVVWLRIKQALIVEFRRNPMSNAHITPHCSIHEPKLVLTDDI